MLGRLFLPSDEYAQPVLYNRNNQSIRDKVCSINVLVHQVKSFHAYLLRRGIDESIAPRRIFAFSMYPATEVQVQNPVGRLAHVHNGIARERTSRIPRVHPCLSTEACFSGTVSCAPEHIPNRTPFAAQTDSARRPCQANGARERGRS